MGRIGVVTAVLFAVLAPGAWAAFDPAYEQSNYSKMEERGKRDADPAFQALLREKGLENQVYREQLRVDDPERDPFANLCANKQDGCAGDVRLYDWGSAGFGVVQRVLFTNRAGATISGNVWMTKAGPAKRPGVVITNGSVQAPEELYWFAATTLAKRGFVVLTFDPQGQGYSDTNGEGADQDEGVPAQSGRPFFDGTEDAIDFFLSTPAQPFVPRKSCTTGTSHAAKQERRVREGRNAAYNPFWEAVDPERLGLAGHSFGASGVSFVGQSDPRVDAIVAWDNLRTPDGQEESAPCPSGSAPRAVPPITKPALGMSADYGLFRQPNTSEPDPMAKSEGSLAYSKAGVDTGQLNIRGGTHYEFSYIPNAFFGATLRGIDLVAWYTDAWLEKYVKGDPSATTRLLTGRWRADAASAKVDPDADPNMFSRYYRSRLAFGGFVCEDVREGCPGLGADTGEYSYLAEARTKDEGPAAVAAAPRTTAPGATLPASRSCRSRRAFTIRLRRPRGDRITRVTVALNGRRVRNLRGRALRRARVDLRGLPRTRVRVTVVVRTAKGRRIVTRRAYRTCARRAS